MLESCYNCIHRHEQPWNMVTAMHVSCRKGIPFHKMDAAKCGAFEPTSQALDNAYLREVHRHEVGPAPHKDGRHHGRVWRIVDADGGKRVSGNPHFWLWFNSEKELDAFREKYAHLMHPLYI